MAVGLKGPIPLIDPEFVGPIVITDKNIRPTVVVKVPHRQSMPFGVTKALSGCCEISLPVIQPKPGLAFTGDHRIQVPIAIQVC